MVTVDDADLAELVSRGLSGGAAGSSGERLAAQTGDAPPVRFADIWTAIHEAGADLVAGWGRRRFRRTVDHAMIASRGRPVAAPDLRERPDGRKGTLGARPICRCSKRV